MHTHTHSVQLSSLFLIGNKTFIEQKNWTPCSRWWTLWTMKQIQEDQELKEIVTKKSTTAVQFVHPQIRAQRNRVRKSKHFRCSKVLALSSKLRALRSCQTNHIKHAGTMFQMIERCFPNQFLQIKKGQFLVNRCCLCCCDGESVDHILLHCKFSQALWCEVFAVFGIQWVMPRSPNSK